MINFLKEWCEGIIVAVVISIIIEMIIPEGNNKKYAKVVIGIYIVFTILNPLIEKKDIDIDFGIFENQESIATSYDSSADVQKVYAKRN